MYLPGTTANGVQDITPIEQDGIAWRSTVTADSTRDVRAIEDAIGRRIDPCQRAEGRQQIERRARIGDDSGGSSAGPPDDGRHPHAALEGGALTSSK